jgi:uncharacterized membrane protein
MREDHWRAVVAMMAGMLYIVNVAAASVRYHARQTGGWPPDDRLLYALIETFANIGLYATIAVFAAVGLVYLDVFFGGVIPDG